MRTALTLMVGWLGGSAASRVLTAQGSGSSWTGMALSPPVAATCGLVTVVGCLVRLVKPSDRPAFHSQRYNYDKPVNSLASRRRDSC